jgi:phosphatidylinositol alpha-1,6-mannosyltransferase
VIQAIPSLLANHPQLLYTVVGDGEDRPRLEALAGALGVAKHMRFLGHVSEEQPSSPWLKS